LSNIFPKIKLRITLKYEKRFLDRMNGKSLLQNMIKKYEKHAYKNRTQKIAIDVVEDLPSKENENIYEEIFLPLPILLKTKDDVSADDKSPDNDNSHNETRF